MSARGPARLALDALLGGLGGEETPLNPHGSPYEMVNKYNLRLDKRPFNWDPVTGYAHLIALFMDTHPVISMMAGAQSGKTGWLLAYAIWTLIRRWGCMMGWFFPDTLLPIKFSQARFAPFVRGNPTLRPWLGRHTKDAKGQDATQSRSFGPSRIFFDTTEGTTSTESMPYQAILFDEVRRMRAHAIQLAEERTSAQIDPVILKASTANYPGEDIDAHFRRGDQRYFHTACGCADGVVLSLLGQECILDLRGATPGLMNKVDHAFSHSGIPLYGLHGADAGRYASHPAVYHCPRCGEIIVNPREGWWEPHEPSHWEHSYQLCQALSPQNPAPRILAKISRPTEAISVQEVWNSVWGLPFIDKTRQPVDLDILMSCVRHDVPWARALPLRERRTVYPNTYAGTDVQRGYLVTVIKAIVGGKWRTVHLEVVHHPEDKWRRLAQMMVEYDIDLMVVDAQPEWDEAIRFAKTFPRRVYLAEFDGNPTADPVRWGDVAQDRKQKGETRFKYMVKIGKVKAYKWSLGRFVRRWNEVPSPKSLIQRIPVHAGKPTLSPDLRIGQMQPVAIAEEVYFKHLTSILIEDKLDGDENARREGRMREVVVEVGLSAHFADANLYADVACSRRPAQRLL